MKTIFKSIALIAAVAATFAACSKVEEQQIEQTPLDAEKEYVYTFALGNSPDTKAILGTDANGRFVEWTSGDQLGSITTKSQGYSNITPADGATPATFAIYSKGGLSEGNTINVWFPYRSKYTDPTAVSLLIPDEQEQRSDDNKFDFKAMPMVAKQITVTSEMATVTDSSPLETIDMVCLGSTINFKVFSSEPSYASEKVISITFNARTADDSADANIAGSFTKDLTTVDPSNLSTLTIPSFTTGYHSVVTSPRSASSIGTDKASALDLYMVVAPGSYRGTVVVKTDAATYTYNLSSAKDLVRAGFKAFGLDLKKAASRVGPTYSSFEKVTSAPVAPETWDGTYIIVTTDGAHVATGSVSSSKLLSEAVTPELDGTITCLDEYALEIAEVSTGIYSIANSAGEYISYGGSSTNISLADNTTDNNAKYTLSISGGHALINNVGADNRFIRWNGSVDFRMYTSSNGSDVDLYKKIDPRVLTSITLSGTHPTAFYTGDAFSSEGLVVTAHYDNGTERVVSPTSITGYDMGATGAQTVTVSYTEKAVTKTATYDITVSARPVFTVTYSDGGSDTEASGGSGVTLPVRSDSGDWKFQGWSESEVASETTTAPTVLTGTYHPDANITLYPVYKKTVEEPGTPTWNNTTSLVAGKTYVFGAVKAAASKTLADNTTFGAVAFAQDYNSSSDTWADCVDITPSSSGVVSNASVTAACKWELTSISEGNYIFKKGEKYLYLADTAGSTSGAQCGLNTSGACYLENVNTTCKNAFLLHPTSESTKIMLYNTGQKGYRMYAPRSYTASMTPYIRFYVETIPVTENHYYISNPT